MLLVHQAGAVKVGEVVRYTVTYTPSSDRILPSPSHLYVRVKNTSAVPLRAAYLHGPYTLHVSTYPTTFNPNQKLETPKRDGIPEFEPNLKAGGNFHSRLSIPEDIRESGEKANIKRNTDGSPRKCTWIIEVASQILFSNTAVVHYEILVGRDERSLDMGFAAIAGKGHGEPGQIKDFQNRDVTSPSRSTQPKGVYSNAIDLMVEDTTTLWNKPSLPQWEDDKRTLPMDQQNRSQDKAQGGGPRRKRKPKKVHLVVLTHGLHSNIGADMLYLKESIDASSREAREAARERKRTRREKEAKRNSSVEQSNKAQRQNGSEDTVTNSTAPLAGGQDRIADDEADEDEEDEDDEQVIVRGFSGNACRTDRGVQYLGKRLAKFVLTTTYPDQPFLPDSKSRTFAGAFGTKTKSTEKYGAATHQGSSIHRKDSSKTSKEDLPYTFSSISFIGHSLGGLVQIYAAAYIHKHSPGFFDHIKPKNFVAMATPLLGLSNENPLYIKFALDFGLVGRTGQDLGLTWRAPTIARSGWSAMIAGFGGGNGQQQQKQPEQEEDPRSKPLLRILPTGPAHQVLKMFKNRTLYANAVNDGIVPLRTSSLLFLDWRGLDKVENARRENGLIGTMAAFGWAELTGANTESHRPPTATTDEGLQSPVGRQSSTSHSPPRQPPVLQTDVPQPSNANTKSAVDKTPSSPAASQFLAGHPPDERAKSSDGRLQTPSDSSESRTYTLPNNPLTDFINYFRPSPAKAHPNHPRRLSKKVAKTYHRAQTIKKGEMEPDDPGTKSEPEPPRPTVARGYSLEQDPSRVPPPKTSIFDAASDILNPPLPPQSWLVDPTKRNRTIFHDRIYHPKDIPPPPAKRPRLGRSFSSQSMRSTSSQTKEPIAPVDEGSVMRVEEKIARAYHHDMSWRKVLVQLEPDAHNNMIVRRMFANAYGWDVVKHVCDTHFAHSFAAETRDEQEPGEDRAMPLEKPVTRDAEEVHGQTEMKAPKPQCDRTTSEMREAADEVVELEKPIAATSNLASGSSSSSKPFPRLKHENSVQWTDSMFDDADEGDDSEDEHLGPFETFQRFWQGSPKSNRRQSVDRSPPAPPHAQIANGLTKEPLPLDTHRGLGAVNTPPPPAATHQLADADAMEPLKGEAAQPEEVEDLEQRIGSPGGTADVGLKKPPDAHVGGSEGSSRDGQAGVAEQVARLSLGSRDGDRSA